MTLTLNPNRPYRRFEIDLVFKALKATMHKDAIQRGIHYDNESIALYYDCYTGKMFRGGDRYDYEHIISAEAIFSHYKSTRTNEEIAQIVNHPDNLKVTLRTINQYKGKYDLQTRILNNPSKIKQFNIDSKLAKINLQNAELAVFGIK